MLCDVSGLVDAAVVDAAVVSIVTTEVCGVFVPLRIDSLLETRRSSARKIPTIETTPVLSTAVKLAPTYAA